MEEILKYIGNWGNYQLYVFFIVLLPMLMSGNLTVISTFTMGVPNTRCSIPGYDNGSTVYQTPFDNNVSEYLLLDPKLQSSGEIYCYYCNPNSTLYNNNKPTCTSDIAQECSSYIYDKSQYKSSVTELFGMVCGDVWKYQLLQSLFSVGVLFGSAFFGSLGDRYGRRVAFLSAALSQIVVLNLVPISYNFYAYCFMIILTGGLQYGAYLTAFIVVMELFGGFPKTVFGIWSHGFFSVGYLYVGLMAYLIRHWEYLQWSVSILSLLYIPYIWIFPESIRWLVVNNKPHEAERAVRKAARWNKVTIPEDVIRRELYMVNDEPQVTVVELFRHKRMAIVTTIVFFTWLVDSLCYYGLSWNIAWLPGNTYANFVLSGSTDLVSYIFCIPIMEAIGHRTTLVLFFAIGGISLIISAFMTLNKLVILFTLIGRFTIAAAFGITYIYTAEIFPTVVRNSAAGFSSVASRIGGISAPQIGLLSDYAQKWVPVVIYGSFGLTAAVADCFLPETKGKPLTETIEQGLEFLKQQPPMCSGLSRRSNQSKVDADNAK